jgi:uncharacterized damage-inducible protein DinB
MQATQELKTLEGFLMERWEQATGKMEALAAELPEDRWEWRPCADMRTCGEVLRHVAFWNQYAADSLRGKEANDSLNELPAADYPTKARVLEAVRRSASEVSAALGERHAGDHLKTAELILPFLEHASEHYGQLAVYARLLNMVPPASRG